MNDIVTLLHYIVIAALLQLHRITDRMVRSLDSVDVGSFLSEIDRSVEASRDVFRHLDNVINKISPEQWEQVQLKVSRNRSRLRSMEPDIGQGQWE